MDRLCRLCLEKSAPYDNLIEIFDDKEDSLKMAEIINRHFTWLQMKPNDEFSKTICIPCRNIINEFDSLYIRVEAAHKELNKKLKNKTLISSISGLEENINSDDDKTIDDIDSFESVTLNELPIKIGVTKSVRKPKENDVKNPKIRICKSKTERLEGERKIREFFDLSCDKCSVKFPTFFNLKVHQQSEHNYKDGFVYCCNKKMNRQAKLFEHMNWHLNPDLFRCKICQKVYSDNYGLRLHMAYHIPETKTLECDICSKKFSRKTQLTHHLMLVHVTKDKKDHKCTECDKTFGLKSILQGHIRGVHQNFYRHICDICAKEFKSKDQYQRHRLQHLAATPKVVCDCGARLKNAVSLQAHVRRQHQKNPQTCPECGKISPNVDALRNHIRYNHQTSRQYNCAICNKSFKKELSLKEHMAAHLGITLYTCPYCPKTFNSNANMHSHKKKCHFTEWERDRTRSASNC